VSSDCATPFSDRVFTEELAHLFGWKTRDVETSVGLEATLVERGPLWAREVVVPPLSPYSALRGPLELAEAGLLELSARLTAEGVPATLSLPPGLTGHIEHLPGWTRSTRHTYVLPTGTYEEVLAACSASTRRNIRRAANTFVETRDPARIREVVPLIAAAYSRNGRRIPAPQDGLSRLAMKQVDEGRAYFLALETRAEGRIEAGIVALHDGDNTAWYWLAGSVPGVAMSVLVARMSVLLNDRQLGLFDLMGANTPSISEFKRRFGGQLASYHHLSAPGRGPAMVLASLRPFIGRLRAWHSAP